MALVCPDVGEPTLLAQNIAAFNSQPTVYHLFKNDVTPAAGSVLGDFTEANFTGYASKNVNDWGAVVEVSGEAVSVASDQVWTVGVIGTGNDIYGYYVTYGGTLIFAERAPGAPIDMNTEANTLTITPRFTGRSQT